MKTVFAIISAIFLLAVIGSAVALKEWVDQYVALSLLTTAPPDATRIVIRSQHKAIAKKTISLAIKNDRPNYAEMTIRDLKVLAKGTGIKNWSRLTKGALIAALNATH